ncbi:hypothetical protein B0T24DRAFT_197557 [Lasiosphaeria ovina]|uniref:DUF6594 domain-containing protein n=1 Tax=Lasiosphaeria ovina TaxID=92902 RepID=A0AAE0NFP3_9PEZI|nr:hypothetical protein B0T24DRAFT_197557 [Lasiosphaeria ovina]
MKSQLKSLKSWLDDSEGGNSFLTNYETATWEDDDLHSYVCLEPPSAKGDPFTKWLLNSAVRAFDRVLGRYIGCGVVVDDQTGDRSYSSDGVNRASNIIAAAVASALPVLAIYVLNGISSVERRIGATAGFTVAFAVLMGYFSSATRAEMIAATATFAAIEVVFIGTAISAGSAGDQSTNVSINGTLCSNGTTVG